MSTTTPPKRKHTAFRIPPDDLKRIDKSAKHHGITRTDYVLRCALGEPLTHNTTNQRLEALEARLQQLEELAYGPT